MSSLTAVRSPSPPTVCRSLAEYVTALVHRLGDADPLLLARLRLVVGARRARIRLDAEAIDVHFADDGTFVVQDAAVALTDGEGGTDRATTIELLAGRLEVSDAILDGRLYATGDIESLVRIFQAIEILLDGATRTPGLQRLARDWLHDPCRTAPPPAPPSVWRRITLDPDRIPAGERDMLDRLDLLP
jgi:hypothetical protein